MSIEVYVFEDKDGNLKEWQTQNRVEAKEYAQKWGLVWIAITYEYSDREVVQDFTREDDKED